MIVLSRQIIDFTIPDETNDHKPAVIFDYNQQGMSTGHFMNVLDLPP
ncbi:hypothetical protein T09_11909 [Trichinella sp. T9]|nr:hypothetical protein T09_11909 [Trichinella sp. T9]